MQRFESISVACLVVLAASLAGCGESDEPVAWNKQADGGAPVDLGSVDIDMGKKAYLNSCALCHGLTGHGDGPMAGALNPPPRGFVNEEWRYVDDSSPSKLRDDIARVIRDGLPDSGMPASGAVLPEDQIRAVTEYVLILHSGG